MDPSHNPNPAAKTEPPSSTPQETPPVMPTNPNLNPIPAVKPPSSTPQETPPPVTPMHPPYLNHNPAMRINMNHQQRMGTSPNSYPNPSLAVTPTPPQKPPRGLPMYHYSYADAVRINPQHHHQQIDLNQERREGGGRGGGGRGGGGGGESADSDIPPAKRGRGRARGESRGGGGGGGGGGEGNVGSDNAHVKRGKGRPRGSLNRSLNASERTEFTTDIIHVEPGEDIASHVMALTEEPPITLCVISATGSVTNPRLCQSSNPNTCYSHEGVLDIVTLSGSFSNYEVNGVVNRIGNLTVALAAPNGALIGGVVVGRLVAASQVKVVVGSFVEEKKTQDESSRGNNALGQNLGPALPHAGRGQVNVGPALPPGGRGWVNVGPALPPSGRGQVNVGPALPRAGGRGQVNVRPALPPGGRGWVNVGPALPPGARGHGQVNVGPALPRAGGRGWVNVGPALPRAAGRGWVNVGPALRRGGGRGQVNFEPNLLPDTPRQVDVRPASPNDGGGSDSSSDS